MQRRRSMVGSADHPAIQRMSEGCLIANRNTFITAAGRAKVAAACKLDCSRERAKDRNDLIEWVINGD